MALSENILDSAYQLAKKAHTPATRLDAKDELKKQYPQCSWDEIQEAYCKAHDLAEKCYEVGDQARREKIPDEEALKILTNRFPGFSRETYSDVLTLGWFLSR